jgi:quercetin 2,3-dioxygenase
MITLRRDKDRYHVRHRRHDVWQTFHPDGRTGARADCFGTLERFTEDRLSPGAGAPRHRHREAEIVTYVFEGALAHEDSAGSSGVLSAGEFQSLSAGRGLRHSETNASRFEPALVFQIELRPSQAELEPSREQKRFSVAERHGRLCVIASPDGRRGSLRIHQDALVYSALLQAGQHVVHELSQGRGAWLHVVRGEVTMGDSVLGTGDGAGVTIERSVSLTAWGEAEILLLDLGEVASAEGGTRRKRPRPPERA